MALDKGKIKELLGCGLTPEQVADAVGTHGSYIAELLADETFANEVVALRAANLTADSERDKKINSIEDTLIDKVREIVDNGQIYKPNELLSAFRVINQAQRRGVPAHATMLAPKQVVPLMIPQVVVNNFALNAQGEVINIDGQTMITMPTQQLLKKLTDERGDEASGDRYKKVSGYLPGSQSVEVIQGE